MSRYEPLLRRRVAWLALSCSWTVVSVAGAQTSVSVNSGQRLTESALRTGVFGSQQFTLSPDLTIQVNSNGVIGPVGDGARATIFDFAGSTVNINRSGLFAERSGAGNLLLNLRELGRIGRLFTASGATVNILGGTVEDEFGAFQSVVNIFGGSVGDDVVVLSETTFNISGGSVGADLRVFRDSALNITGGSIGSGLRALDGSEVNVSGGSVEEVVAESGGAAILSGGIVGELSAKADAVVNIFGGEFQLNGAPVSQLADGLTAGELLSGTLADGSVFIFSGSLPPFGGIAPGSTTLNAVALPPADLTPMLVSTGAGPNGLRAGQTLTITGDASLGTNFGAVDATLNIEGGVVGDGLETVSSRVNITGGQVGQRFTAYPGSEVTIAGGAVGRDFEVFPGASASISGGSVGDSLFTQGEATISGGEVGDGLRASFGSAVRITGGNMGDGAAFSNGSELVMSGGSAGDRLSLSSGSQADISGGRIGRDFRAEDGSAVRISGGTFGRQFFVQSGADATIAGGEFQIDGALAAQLPGGGLDPGALFTGTLADGSVFIFSSDMGDMLAPGAITLQSAPPPPADTTPMVVSTGQGPSKGLRAGQSLTVRGDAALPEHFAAVDATLNIEGGSVGKALESAFSQVNITGGTVGASFAAFDSVVDISGGRVLPNFQAHGATNVNLFVTDLRIGGSDIDLALGERLIVEQRGGALLFATLADGSFLDFTLNDNFSLAMSVGMDFFDADATLAVTRVPGPGGGAGLLLAGAALALQRRRARSCGPA